MSIGKSAKVVTYIYTRDPTKAKAFYGSTLGFAQTSEDPFASVFDLNGVELRIVQIPDHVAHPHPVIGWEVADIAASIKGLREHGVTMNIYEGMGQDEVGIWASPDGKTKLAFFNDPDGNGLSLASHL
jgi:catechol 2,3-dioxygenase-like lactoylglutathione lyase family enzyme